MPLSISEAWFALNFYYTSSSMLALRLIKEAGCVENSIASPYFIPNGDAKSWYGLVPQMTDRLSSLCGGIPVNGLWFMSAADFFTGPLYCCLILLGRGVFILRTYLFGWLFMAAVGFFSSLSYYTKSIWLRSSFTIYLIWLFEFFYAMCIDLFFSCQPRPVVSMLYSGWSAFKGLDLF